MSHNLSKVLTSIRMNLKSSPNEPQSSLNLVEINSEGLEEFYEWLNES